MSSLLSRGAGSPFSALEKQRQNSSSLPAFGPGGAFLPPCPDRPGLSFSDDSQERLREDAYERARYSAVDLTDRHHRSASRPPGTDPREHHTLGYAAFADDRDDFRSHDMVGSSGDEDEEKLHVGRNPDAHHEQDPTDHYSRHRGVPAYYLARDTTTSHPYRTSRDSRHNYASWAAEESSSGSHYRQSNSQHHYDSHSPLVPLRVVSHTADTGVRDGWDTWSDHRAFRDDDPSRRSFPPPMLAIQPDQSHNGVSMSHSRSSSYEPGENRSSVDRDVEPSYVSANGRKLCRKCRHEMDPSYKFKTCTECLAHFRQRRGRLIERKRKEAEDKALIESGGAPVQICTRCVKPMPVDASHRLCLQCRFWFQQQDQKTREEARRQK